MARVESVAVAGTDYARLGYALLGRVLSDEQVRALSAEEERFRPRSGSGTRDNNTLRVAVQLCHKSQAVREVATRGPHIADVVRLLGPDACLTHVQFVTKMTDDMMTDGGRPVLDDPHSWMVAGEAREK